MMEKGGKDHTKAQETLQRLLGLFSSCSVHGFSAPLPIVSASPVLVSIRTNTLISFPPSPPAFVAVFVAMVVVFCR